MPTERTPLTSAHDVPPYVFIQSYNRSYRNKIRKFQCCLCAALMAILMTGLVITISYSVNHDIIDNKNATNSSSPQGINDTITTLLSLSFPLTDQSYPNWSNAPNQTTIDLATAQGFKALWKRQKYEEFAPTLLKDTPSYRHHLAMKTLPKARQLAETGFVLNAASEYLSKKREKTKDCMGRLAMENTDWLPEEVCHKSVNVSCVLSRYRSADGSCNNLKNPSTWGVALRPFRRILPPDYADGVSSPRQATDGSFLPSAREVSLFIHRPLYRDDPNFTVMLAVWGQFIDHDITATALSQSKSGEAISCCFEYVQSGIKSHPECFSVEINRPDPYFEQFNVNTYERRTYYKPSILYDIVLRGPREQMNQASSFLDGSVVYGANDELMNQLRTFQGGQLKTLITPDGQELLPISTDPNDGCNQKAELANGRYCFLTGDPRANENIHLTTLHLLIVRQHNQIAQKLFQVNPHWDDEKIFQETRKIISAEIQHITYNEFLPIVLGDNIMKNFQNNSSEFEHSKFYDETIDPSIANSFASSAFRFGHTLLPGLIKFITNESNSAESIETHKMLFNPFKLYDKNFLENAVRGAMNTSILKVDTYFSLEFTEHLFEKEGHKPKGLCGLDLVSLNVQRGRDHGLPGYPKWREHCGLSKPKTFEDLINVIDSDSLLRLKELYKSVDDIDMYTGALAEIPVAGSLVGPTITCLLTDQFVRLQRGDRFWFETSQNPQAFSKAQLSSIRNMTLAKLICETSNVTNVQPLVMRRATAQNPQLNCSELQKLDLTLWKEPQLNRIAVGESMTLLTKPEKSTLRISGFVSGGSVTLSKSTIWLGNRLPISLPKKPTSKNDVRWTGYLKTSTPGLINWWGSYSIRDSLNSTWFNGDFAFKIQTFWISSDTVDRFGSYRTKVDYFEMDSFQNLTQDWSLEVTEKMDISPSISGNAFNNSRVIFLGTYAEKQKEFIWGGNITLIFD